MHLGLQDTGHRSAPAIGMQKSGAEDACAHEGSQGPWGAHPGSPLLGREVSHKFGKQEFRDALINGYLRVKPSCAETSSV